MTIGSQAVKCVTLSESDISPALDQEIRTFLCECFPKAEHVFSTTRAWHGSKPAWSVICRDEKTRIVAHLGIADRTISVGGFDVRVGGIQNVCVSPLRRGAGLSRILLEATEEVLHSNKLDAGLLFCTEDLVPVYTAKGWRLLSDASVTRVDSDHGNTELPLPDGSLAMWLPAKLSQWPTGRIHLRGNDW